MRRRCRRGTSPTVSGGEPDIAATCIGNGLVFARRSRGTRRAGRWMGAMTSQSRSTAQARTTRCTRDAATTGGWAAPATTPSWRGIHRQGVLERRPVRRRSRNRHAGLRGQPILDPEARHGQPRHHRTAESPTARPSRPRASPRRSRAGRRRRARCPATRTAQRLPRPRPVAGDGVRGRLVNPHREPPSVTGRPAPRR